MLIVDVILLVVCTVLAVLVVARHRAHHVDRFHLDEIRKDYGWPNTR